MLYRLKVYILKLLDSYQVHLHKICQLCNRKSMDDKLMSHNFINFDA